MLSNLGPAYVYGGAVPLSRMPTSGTVDSQYVHILPSYRRRIQQYVIQSSMTSFNAVAKVIYWFSIWNASFSIQTWVPFSLECCQVWSFAFISKRELTCLWFLWYKSFYPGGTGTFRYSNDRSANELGVSLFRNDLMCSLHVCSMATFACFPLWPIATKPTSNPNIMHW